MKILLALEGPSDLRRVRWLLDQWLEDNVDWFDPDDPSSCRELIGTESEAEYIQTHSIPKLRKDLVGGGFGGRHPRGDAGTIHDLLIVLKKLDLHPDVVLWLRDADGTPDRAVKAAAMVEESGESERFIIGYPQQVSEAWVLVGWVAESPEEDKRAEEARKGLKRRLPRDAHLLTHKDIPGGAKWALRILAPSDDREKRALLRAWTLGDREIKACGLLAFRSALNSNLRLRDALGLSVHGPSPPQGHRI